MLSIPPATTALASPLRISRAARLTALRDDAQTLFTVSAGTLVGRPALMAACRAGIWPIPAVSEGPLVAVSTTAPSPAGGVAKVWLAEGARSGARRGERAT